MNNALEKEFAAKNPGKWNPYGALRKCVCLPPTQMPDELGDGR